MHERRQALGGYLPARSTEAPPLEVPALAAFDKLLESSGKREISLDDLALVERYDFDRNRVSSRGRARPSSESMTHGAAYDLGPQVRCVLHAHSPVLWQRAQELRLPRTDPSVQYGTPEMAREVQRLYRGGLLAERRILAMAGHDDGILVFGRSLEEAGQVLLAWLARAYESECRGGVCRLDD